MKKITLIALTIVFGLSAFAQQGILGRPGRPPMRDMGRPKDTPPIDEARRAKIRARVRSTVKGTAERPRLSVFRSNKQIYAQLIDDLSGKTIVSAGSLKEKAAQDGNKINQASVVGKMIAEKAQKAGITSVVFDRNGYLYHGRVKSLADAAREGGLKF